MARPFEPEHLLQKPLMAILATRCPHGPRTAPVWFLWQDGALWMLGDVGGSSVQRIEDDPSVSVEITEFDPARGILLHLGLRGTAEVQLMHPNLFRQLLTKYLGPAEDRWNPWFIAQIARIDDPDGRLIRLRPDSVFTNNGSFFLTGPELAWP